MKTQDLYGDRPLERIDNPQVFVASLTPEQRMAWLRRAVGSSGSSLNEIATLILDAIPGAALAGDYGQEPRDADL